MCPWRAPGPAPRRRRGETSSACPDCRAATAAAAPRWDRQWRRPACRSLASARRHWEFAAAAAAAAAAAPAPGSRPVPRRRPRQRQRSGNGATPSPRRSVRPFVPSAVPRKPPNQPTSGARAPNGSRPAAGWRSRVNGVKTDMVNGRLSFFTLPCRGRHRRPSAAVLTPTLCVGYVRSAGVRSAGVLPPVRCAAPAWTLAPSGHQPREAPILKSSILRDTGLRVFPLAPVLDQ